MEFGTWLAAIAAGVFLWLVPADTAGAAAYKEEWGAACYWTDLVGFEDACEGVEPPTVVYSDRVIRFLSGWNTLGMFINGENNIYLSPAAIERTKTDTSEVIVHEMVHYILDQAGATAQLSRCQNEEVARMVTDLYKQRSYTTDWKDWYNCRKELNYGN